MIFESDSRCDTILNDNQRIFNDTRNELKGNLSHLNMMIAEKYNEMSNGICDMQEKINEILSKDNILLMKHEIIEQDIMSLKPNVIDSVNNIKSMHE
jgi:hypothetical protein